MKASPNRKSGFYLTLMLFCNLMLGCGQVDNANIPLSAETWRSLFDGETLLGWTGLNGATIGDGWEVVDSNLVLTARGAGDLLTLDTFRDFELQLEWKISVKGNSGILYRVANGDQPVWMSGMEYQVLDHEAYPGLVNSSRTAGAVFDLYAPSAEVVNPVGQFNQTRIRVEGNNVEHWLNGHKIISYTLWSDDWTVRFDNSKFATYKDFGRIQQGHIALQDHGDQVSYRNIRIKEL